MLKLQFKAIYCVLGVYMHTALSASTWDFAVTTGSKIIFYNEHWETVTSTAHQFEQLTALAFDESEEMVYFTDRLHNNGSIFAVKLPTLENEQHIIEKTVQRTKDESIEGIAYDPLNRNIFWTDKRNRKIFFSSVDPSRAAEPKVLLDFANDTTRPDGIAIDICRRKLYFTNSNPANATVERVDLDGQNREIIIKSDLHLPHGIVVDQLTDRLYWVVDQEGIYFSVESAYLDGSDRIVLVKGFNKVPMNLAVTKDAIFWTDRSNNAVWGHTKYANISEMDRSVADGNEPNLYSAPRKILDFLEQPRGIVARTHFFTKLENDIHCAGVVKKIKNRLLTPKPTRSPVDMRIENLQREFCLNDGEYSEQSNACICKIGFRGSRCETNECHNFCMHGSCSISSLGFPQCSCQHGFYGEHCQLYKCSNYCLNDGHCKIEGDEPACECRNNFGGERCEHNSTEICALFCRILKHEPETFVPFGCHDICSELAQQSEDVGGASYAIPKYQHLEVCKTTTVFTSTVILVLVCGVVSSLFLVLLIVQGLRRFYKPARPRIKKTFVVRKQAASSSDTPLTNRPMATEQCEITIENCCNMNICDTPCFDPKFVQQSLSRDTKEDKKVLIHSMEDELY